VGSSISVEVGCKTGSEMAEVKGTEPVSTKLRIAKAISARPRERERYSSRGVDWRTWGERIVVIMVGETMRGSASRHNHVADM